MALIDSSSRALKLSHVRTVAALALEMGMTASAMKHACLRSNANRETRLRFINAGSFALEASRGSRTRDGLSTINRPVIGSRSGDAATRIGHMDSVAVLLTNRECWRDFVCVDGQSTPPLTGGDPKTSPPNMFVA